MGLFKKLFVRSLYKIGDSLYDIGLKYAAKKAYNKANSIKLSEPVKLIKKLFGSKQEKSAQFTPELSHSHTIIGACFNISKATSGSYGQEFWKIVWGAVDPTVLYAVAFYEGDTEDTLNGRADVYCIAFKSFNVTYIENIAVALASYKPFQDVAAEPMFIKGSRCEAEPLVAAGMIDGSGRFTEGASNPKRALAALKGVSYEFFDDPDWKFKPPFL
jgi:hypothetical protein